MGFENIEILEAPSRVVPEMAPSEVSFSVDAQGPSGAYNHPIAVTG